MSRNVAGPPPKVMKSQDRRITRTQRLLHEALIALIFERGWDAVTVQEICERADVGRSTFYVHFADKEELLLSGFDVFERSLRAEVEVAAGKSLAFLKPLLEHVRVHQRLYLALVGKRSGQLTKQRLLGVVSAMVHIELAERIPAGARREAAVRYIAGAFLEVLTWWLESRTGLQVEELESIYRELTTPVLAALRRASG